MLPAPREDITRLLEAAAEGRARATDELLSAVYDELRRMAEGIARADPVNANRTLQPTALVHEAYLRLIGPGEVRWQNRAHFFGAAARAMRRILIDRARSARARRSGSLRDPSLGADPASPVVPVPEDADELLALDGALDRLGERDPRQHEVVLLRFYAGLTIEQTASTLGLSPATIKNEWSYARAWLVRETDRLRPGGDR